MTSANSFSISGREFRKFASWLVRRYRILHKIVSPRTNSNSKKNLLENDSGYEGVDFHLGTPVEGSIGIERDLNRKIQSFGVGIIHQTSSFRRFTKGRLSVGGGIYRGGTIAWRLQSSRSRFWRGKWVPLRPTNKMCAKSVQKMGFSTPR